MQPTNQLVIQLIDAFEKKKTSHASEKIDMIKLDPYEFSTWQNEEVILKKKHEYSFIIYSPQVVPNL